MATELQVNKFAYHIRVNRGLTKVVFPDRVIESGANMYLRDTERWAREQDSQVLYDIIGLFDEDKPELAIEQIKQLQ